MMVARTKMVMIEAERRGCMEGYLGELLDRTFVDMLDGITE